MLNLAEQTKDGQYVYDDDWLEAEIARRAEEAEHVSKHKRGERFEGYVRSEVHVPPNYHVAYAGEKRVALPNEPLIVTGDAELNNMLYKRAYEILMVVPDVPEPTCDTCAHDYAAKGTKPEHYDGEPFTGPVWALSSNDPGADKAKVYTGEHRRCEPHEWAAAPDGDACRFTKRPSGHVWILRVVNLPIAAIHEHNKPECPDWWKEGWYACDKAIANNRALFEIKAADLHLQTGYVCEVFRPATLDDLRVTRGGVDMWAYVDDDGYYITNKPGVNATWFNKKGSLSCQRFTALWEDGPVIPNAQWESLIGQEKTKS